MGGAVGVQTTDPFIKGKKVKNPKRKKEEKKKRKRKRKKKKDACILKYLSKGSSPPRDGESGYLLPDVAPGQCSANLLGHPMF